MEIWEYINGTVPFIVYWMAMDMESVTKKIAHEVGPKWIQLYSSLGLDPRGGSTVNTRINPWKRNYKTVHRIESNCGGKWFSTFHAHLVRRSPMLALMFHLRVHTLTRRIPAPLFGADRFAFPCTLRWWLPTPQLRLVFPGIEGCIPMHQVTREYGVSSWQWVLKTHQHIQWHLLSGITDPTSIHQYCHYVAFHVLLGMRWLTA